MTLLDPAMIDAASGRRLAGDWRRLKGRRTDAHLFPASAILPLCGLRLARRDSERVPLGYACVPCLLADAARRRAS